jgi:hypothetical protein
MPDPCAWHSVDVSKHKCDKQNTCAATLSRQDQSQNHIWDKGKIILYYKALDILVIYRLNIIETDITLGNATSSSSFRSLDAKQLYSNISTEFLPLSSVQSNRAVFPTVQYFRIARLYHRAICNRVRKWRHNFRDHEYGSRETWVITGVHWDWRRETSVTN